MKSIRNANINDRYEIEELVKVMIGDENPEEVAKSVVEGLLGNSNYSIFVIEVYSSVKGFGAVKFEPFEGGNNIAEIVWLGIEHENKRKGLGSKLVQHMEQFCRENDIRKIYVKTSVRNKFAVCFWIMQNYKFEARLLDFSLKSFDDYYLGKDL